VRLFYAQAIVHLHGQARKRLHLDNFRRRLTFRRAHLVEEFGRWCLEDFAPLSGVLSDLVGARKKATLV
jgi:hypothetical protein